MTLIVELTIKDVDMFAKDANSFRPVSHTKFITNIKNDSQELEFKIAEYLGNLNAIFPAMIADCMQQTEFQKLKHS